MDDRYLSYEHYTFVQAALIQAESLYPPSTLPFEVDSQQTVFVESGLTTITAFDYYIIYNQGKAGVFRVYNRRSREILLNDTGVVVLDEKNSAIVSGWLQLHLKPEFEIEQKNDEKILRSGGVLVRYRDTVPNSIYMVLSRVGLTVISSSFWLRRKILDILRSKLITKRPKPRGRFQRELKLDSMKLRVTDTIDPFDKKKNRVLVTNRTTDRYITSKQFGQFQDILSIKPLKTEIAFSDSSVTVIREYDLSAPMVPAQSYIFTQERSLKG